MENSYGKWGIVSTNCRAWGSTWRGVLAALAALLVAAVPARAQEQLMFPATDDAQQVLLQKIRAEQVRLDVATWLLVDGEIVQAIINKHLSGVPVRVIGDRAAIWESDPNTRASFLQLANAGVPIRLRYHPTWFPEIMHWKSAIFVGQNTVEFGSANLTTFELKPVSALNFKDETVLFSSTPAIVRAFLTMFDRMWADTTAFLDWPAAYQGETGTAWTRPMHISRGRLEPDYPTDVPAMVWSQGTELVNRMIAEIDAETQAVDLVLYRLTVPELTDALIRRHRAGVQVRVFVEPTQYRNNAFPEYWLTGAMVDRLWAAGVPIRERTHQGLTHMKTLITSRVAMIGSANFTRFWQRDHNYFVEAAASPSTYFAMKDRFSAMWNDGLNYRPFNPQRPDFAQLQTPATGAANVPTSTALVWKGTPWAVAFDVFLGTDPGNLPLVGRVNAVLTEEPPPTYSFVPQQGLQPSTRYYWRVAPRTHATDVHPGLTTTSELFAFVTAATVSSPANGPATCVGPAPGAGWTCVKGAWLPPVGGTQPPPAPSPNPAPPASSCTTASPAPGWVCVNGGWVPADHPLAAGAAPAPAPAPTVPIPPPPSPAPSTCTTIQPASDWSCVNGGWLPPGSPLAVGTPVPAPQPPAPTAPPPPVSSGTCTTPDPFVTIGGGVCVNGGWVPKGHSAAGGG
jgi:phosphatidylserine/phosphatidylglycerophosphate/cardiolipin synthase-like enzyme